MKLRAWLKSFRFAYEGLLYALSTQKNMKFHFVLAFAVFLLALFLQLDKLDILFILLAVTLVLITELINTAIEKTVDLTSPDPHPLAKVAKDVAAAAVLVAAVFAAAVGVIIFYEPFDLWLHNMRGKAEVWEIAPVWVIGLLVLLSIIVLHARFSRRLYRLQPSLISAIVFSAAMMIALQVQSTVVVILAMFLAGMFVFILMDKTKRSFSSIIMGSLLGILLTLGIYLLI